MNDSPLARWTVLILVALMMFFAYMFVDVMSPLKSLVESNLGWNSSVFGTYAASEYILNVCGFLIIAGVILDKLGVRFSGVLSAAIMVLGAAIKFIGVSDWFTTTSLYQWLGTWWVDMPASAKMASLGFMIFGCGCEMEGTNVSKILAKWFKGKEMALAMGLEMAIARLDHSQQVRRIGRCPARILRRPSRHRPHQLHHLRGDGYQVRQGPCRCRTRDGREIP